MKKVPYVGKEEKFGRFGNTNCPSDMDQPIHFVTEHRETKYQGYTPYRGTTTRAVVTEVLLESRGGRRIW